MLLPASCFTNHAFSTRDRHILLVQLEIQSCEIYANYQIHVVNAARSIGIGSRDFVRMTRFTSTTITVANSICNYLTMRTPFWIYGLDISPFFPLELFFRKNGLYHSIIVLYTHHWICQTFTSHTHRSFATVTRMTHLERLLLQTLRKRLRSRDCWECTCGLNPMRLPFSVSVI